MGIHQRSQEEQEQEGHGENGEGRQEYRCSCRPHHPPLPTQNQTYVTVRAPLGGFALGK